MRLVYSPIQELLQEESQIWPMTRGRTGCRHCRSGWLVQGIGSSLFSSCGQNSGGNRLANKIEREKSRPVKNKWNKSPQPLRSMILLGAVLTVEQILGVNLYCQA